MVHDYVAMGNNNRYVLPLCMISHGVWQVFDCWGVGHVLSHDWLLGLHGGDFK